MVDGLLILLAILVAFLAAAILQQAKRIASLQIRITDLERGLVERSLSKERELPVHSILEGLRVAVDIEQDHPRPIFANLLRERLVAEDAEPVQMPADSDVVIGGKVVCNGYAEVFYEAELTCTTRDGVLLTLAETPAQGGRQANLAVSLVARLKNALEQSITRGERLRALREIEGRP